MPLSMTHHINLNLKCQPGVCTNVINVMYIPSTTTKVVHSFAIHRLIKAIQRYPPNIFSFQGGRLLDPRSRVGPVVRAG